MERFPNPLDVFQVLLGESLCTTFGNLKCDYTNPANQISGLVTSVRLHSRLRHPSAVFTRTSAKASQE